MLKPEFRISAKFEAQTRHGARRMGNTLSEYRSRQQRNWRKVVAELPALPVSRLPRFDIQAVEMVVERHGTSLAQTIGLCTVCTLSSIINFGRSVLCTVYAQLGEILHSLFNKLMSQFNLGGIGGSALSAQYQQVLQIIKLEERE